MYCGSCIRDNALARALMAQGHDVLLQPIYTPMRTDEESVAASTVRYGAVNIYLQQKSGLFSRLPRRIRRWLDDPRLLRRLTANPDATNAKELGQMTLSMLEGESGRQRKELDDLVAFLQSDFRPDIVQLTNSMLLGLARRLREALPGAKVVTALQGEDIFLDDLDAPYRERVEAELRRRAGDSHLFVATSSSHGRHMGEFLGIEPERIHLTRLGISFDGYRDEPAQRPQGRRLQIGFFARICPEKGPHQLIDAFLELERRRPGEADLRIAGYLGGRDAAYWATQEQRLAHLGSERVRFEGELDRQGKLDFLHDLDVLSVPTVYAEAKGLSILESMAAGVPVVQPAHGAFPELLERSGGGWLVPPGDIGALADRLEGLLDDEDERLATAERAHRGVRAEFSEAKMAEDTVRAYETVLGRAG